MFSNKILSIYITIRQLKMQLSIVKIP